MRGALGQKPSSYTSGDPWAVTTASPGCSSGQSCWAPVCGRRPGLGDMEKPSPWPAVFTALVGLEEAGRLPGNVRGPVASILHGPLPPGDEVTREAGFPGEGILLL